MLTVRVYSLKKPGQFFYYDVWQERPLTTLLTLHEVDVVRVSIDLDAHSPGCIVSLPITEPAPIFATQEVVIETPYRTPTTQQDHLPKPGQKTRPPDSQAIPENMVLAKGGPFEMHVHHPWVYD